MVSSRFSLEQQEPFREESALLIDIRPGRQTLNSIEKNPKLEHENKAISRAESARETYLRRARLPRWFGPRGKGCLLAES